MLPDAASLDVRRVGSGPPVVLVPGSIVGAERTWRHQLPLAEHWELALVNRPGFAGSPPLERGDFEVEARMIADLLGDSAHLVGHSYGAVIALFAAALRPHAVRSLTISEPGCLNVAAGDATVDATIAHGDTLYDARDLSPRDFLVLFRSGVNSAHETPPELDAELLEGARLAMHERRPWDAEPPLETLAGAPFPKLVISGGHSAAFEAVCDVVARRIGATRTTIAGRGHTIPSAGRPYNEVLHRFLASATPSGPCV